MAHLPPKGGSGNRGYLDGIGALLLGAGALALLFPLVQAESGGLARLWWLFPIAAAVLATFVAWERRVVGRGAQPVFDPRLVTEVRGFAAGAAVGTAYFVGFGGIWVLFAVFFNRSRLHPTAADAEPSAKGMTDRPDCSGV
ncbi:MAG TPA: hypothetical protein VHK28_11155 [Candidatus Limnocylindria bacterium]|nr:hypothetical protein [Candidatus Limnocylindria bacterium]